MIEQNKVKEFSSCNNCGRYNMPPDFKGVKFKECGEIYNYRLMVGRTGTEFRLCKECAKELKEALEKQLGETNVKDN